MKTNKSWMQKADIAISDLEANGGLLQPEESRTFIRKLILSPTILNVARVVGMKSHTMNINKIGFGSRIMRVAVSGTALSSGDRAKPTTEQVVLTSKEVMAEVNLPYDVLEDNIERAEAANNEASNTGPGGLRSTIIELIAERAAADLEELGLLGDTDSGDAYLALFDGWNKLANDNGNVVNRGGQTISKETFKEGKKAMPDQYLRDLASMRHFISMDQETDYRDTVADRATGYGDNTLQGNNDLRAFGSAISPVTRMPNAKGLYTNPLNLLFGIHRDVSMEFDKSIRERVYIIVLTARVAVEIEESEAVVAYTNLG